MKNTFSFNIIFFLLSFTSSAQYSITDEIIVKKSNDLLLLQKNRNYFPVGNQDEKLVYQLNEKIDKSLGYSSEATAKVYYEEVARKVIDSFNIKSQNGKILRVKQKNEITIMYGFFSVPYKFREKRIDDLAMGESLLSYQDIWVKTKDENIKLKSYPEHYYDKAVEYSFDNSGKYILINTFVSDYLRSTDADSIIYGYNFSTKDSFKIFCQSCIKPQIVDDFLYYGKKFYYLKGSDAYDWKIYRAPLNDLTKSELLGEFIEIIEVSPDAKTILCKKNLYGKVVLALLNVSTKKFQYLLGRDYLKLKFFFSPGYNKWAFDLDDEIVYINYPDQFTFKAIDIEMKQIHTTKSENKIFWEKLLPRN
ncbi:hypothetical protein SanaruYs_22060 [Chryseotalea sanaruensis]|uniref:WG repeat-containing protein n=1 Tax=Chryseotalea sanaruensis TaxID=2482724 RepID=A0A401UAR3_9BACT|nr:hypothetical protein [Chryseotalea sanaruensis]GCC51975.1 hypothetical protein SanaruYs_22060 [Chryseotalea sanaruensis]